MSKKKLISLTFSIAGIETVAFELKQLTNLEHLKNIQVQMELGFQAMSDKKWLVVHLPVTYVSEDGTTSLCHAHNNFIYQIENFDEMVKVNPDGSPQIEELAMVQLSSMSISTMRGIMFEKFRGTHLHGVLMNPVDPAALNLKIQSEGKSMKLSDLKRTNKTK